MSEGTEAVMLRKKVNVSITVGGIKWNLTYLVVKDVPLDLIIWQPAMKMMRASLDFDKDTVIFKSGTKKVTTPLWIDKERTAQELSKEFMSGEYTSDEGGYEESQSEIESDVDMSEIEAAEGKRLIVYRMEDCQENLDISYDEEIEDALSSISTDAQELMKHVLTVELAIIAWHLDELPLADVPFRHAFELTDNTPFCPPVAQWHANIMKL